MRVNESEQFVFNFSYCLDLPLMCPKLEQDLKHENDKIVIYIKALRNNSCFGKALSSLTERSALLYIYLYIP
jgi:hypothetical protein